jgi:hypothetical protein
VVSQYIFEKLIIVSSAQHFRFHKVLHRFKMKLVEKGIHYLKNYRDIKKFLLIVPDIISENEEEKILEFVKTKLQRKRYEGDHWDSVITKYKETEMSSTNVPDSVNDVIKRLSDLIKDTTAQPMMQILPPHVLDLAADGYIGIDRFTSKLWI